jgi:hypothetical protein
VGFPPIFNRLDRPVLVIGCLSRLTLSPLDLYKTLPVLLTGCKFVVAKPSMNGMRTDNARLSN